MHDRSYERLNDIAATLLGQRVDAVTAVGNGGENRLWKVSAAGQAFALKTYPRPRPGQHDPLTTEFTALSFLHRHGITDVPRPVKADSGFYAAVYAWIEGTPLTAPGRADVDAITGFLERIQALRTGEDAFALEPAESACLSALAAVEQTDTRLERLKDRGGGFPDLHRFIMDDLEPAAEKAAVAAYHGFQDLGLSFDQPLPRAKQWLSPADFGCHNILKSPDGRLVFLDFERFGRDDPVKLVADTLLHPDTLLPLPLAQRFLEGMGGLFDEQQWFLFRARFQWLYPLYGVLWCMSILNAFLTERGERRFLVGGRLERETAIARRLAAARAALARAHLPAL
ncbi:MAG: hypothetical protein FD149_399 [Rhodospirillaceae bacterium]|nr:MAG: hypothetical protein FD149_399 [Rhodospirillaceae bacterium]